MLKYMGRFGRWLCGKLGHKGDFKVLFGYEARQCARCNLYQKRPLSAERPSYQWLHAYLEKQKATKPRLLIPMQAAAQALREEGTPSAFLALEAIAHELGWKPKPAVDLAFEGEVVEGLTKGTAATGAKP